MIWLPLALALALGFFARRRRGWMAAGGIGVALVIYAAIYLTGGFDDDREGTAWMLTLFYGVPVYALLWAAAVGAGYMLRGLWGRTERRAQ